MRFAVVVEATGEVLSVHEREAMANYFATLAGRVYPEVRVVRL